MRGPFDHDTCVSIWLVRLGGQVPARRQLAAFEVSFRVMWYRAARTLGDVTLGAVVDRVLFTAGKAHPALPPLTVDASGIRCEALRAVAEQVDPAELTALIRFVLVEFLEVLGDLTADILTPALHHELTVVNLDDDCTETSP